MEWAGAPQSHGSAWEATWNRSAAVFLFIRRLITGGGSSQEAGLAQPERLVDIPAASRRVTIQAQVQIYFFLFHPLPLIGGK